MAAQPAKVLGCTWCHAADGPFLGNNAKKEFAGMRATWWKCHSINASNAKERHNRLVQKEVQLTKWPQSYGLDDEDAICQGLLSDLEPLINEIKAMLRSISDGEISISAYDTAWVALVPMLDGGEGPQFPSTIEWIVNNQLPDGSWGDASLFSSYDRLINTLSCVIALTLWSLEPNKCQRGVLFLQQNMWRLEKEDPELMPIGFEIAFPSLVEISRSLSIDFPYDHRALQSIYANRELKLKRIPKDTMHRLPTSILHSLEGMPGLDWSQLLNLQSSDGSFLFSPSATAYALIQTGDKKCFEYLDRTVKKFNGGVPNVYPVDLFEHLWVIDRLERLGIARHFQHEIQDFIDYVNRYWAEEGICWARNSKVYDVDDTAMAFRLLRLHGYNVSPGVFKNFEKDGEFFCFRGQSTQAVTGMYNLNRASQISFPGEEILRRARIFSYNFLRAREATGSLRDKWIFSKDLPGEVQYTLEFPWFACLPRIEARTYLDQYGGDNDVWIGKTLYKMPLVNNDKYLKLARQDFNCCQALHQFEWHGLQKWYVEDDLKTFGVTPEDLLKAYFLAVACIFEPNRAAERLGWARSVVLAKAISIYLYSDLGSKRKKEHYIYNCLQEENGNLTWFRGNKIDEHLVRALLQLIDVLAQEAALICDGQNHIRHHLRCAWMDWMLQQMKFGKDGKNNTNNMTLGSCMVQNKQTSLLLIQIIQICAGQIDEAATILNNLGNSRLIQLTTFICDCLHQKTILSKDARKNEAIIGHLNKELDLKMQELAQNVLQRSHDKTNNNKTKQTFLNVVKSSYYAAHCPPHVIDKHISKVIFERVI